MKNFILYASLLTLLYSCDNKSETSRTPYDSLSFQIYFGDQLAGYQYSWKDNDGTYRGVFEYNDRGRGPKFDEKIRTDETGSITYFEVNGHNYLKDTVNEKFQVNDDEASWESTTEQGKSDFNQHPFYIASSGGFTGTELLIRKLLSSPNQTVDLLPGGTAHLEKSEDVNLGDSLHLKLITITGLDFTPSYTWMDDNGRFFAFTSSWFSCIPQGRSDLIKVLRPIQEESENKFYTELATNLIEKPENDIAITNVNLFDSRKAVLIEHQTVIITGNRISNVGNSDDVGIPDKARVIDGTGKMLLPGFFDNHAHISKSGAILDIAAGVTSIRDMANSLDLPDTKGKFENNTLIGPRITTMCGFIDKAGPYAGPTGKIVNTLQEALEAVDYYKEHGYNQIKLYSSIEPSWVKPITEKAHGLSMKVSGHIPSHMLASQAVLDGYDGIQHINMIALNFLPDTIDTRTPLRFTMVAEHTHELDTASEEFKSFLDLLKTHKTVVDPTVSVFESMFTAKPGEADPSFAMVLNRLPVQIQRSFYGGGLPIPAERDAIYKESYQRLLDMIAALYHKGIPMVPGTDALEGFGLYRELENYVKAGIPASKVLEMATLTSAKVSKVDDQLGSIEKGKLADVILIDGNPLQNISDVRKVILTIKDGNIYDPGKLYNAMGVKFFE